MLLFRRSIVAAKFAQRKKIIFSDLDFKRPGDGLEPIKFKNLIGKILNKNINCMIR